MPKLALSIFFTLATFSCSMEQQETINPDRVNLHPLTPSLDSLFSICEQNLKQLHRRPNMDSNGSVSYYLKGKPFDGWACYNDERNDHQYRFVLVSNGKLVRQIGYFSNGQVDHDFSQYQGKSIGSERMWMMNGNIYVQNYYIAPDVKHDTQLRYYSNGQMALFEVYDSGRLSERKQWDTSGIMK